LGTARGAGQGEKKEKGLTGEEAKKKKRRKKRHKKVWE